MTSENPQTPVITGLLFDKDGTLFDFQASWAHWCKGFLDQLEARYDADSDGAAKAIGFDRSSIAFHAHSSFVMETFDQTLRKLHPFVPALSLDGLGNFAMMTAAEQPQVAAAPLRPLFKSLRGAGLKIGLSTNDGEASAKVHLEDADVLDLFEFVAGYDSGFGGKPEPGMQFAFCDQLNLRPAQVAMVGDSTHDMAAGRAAGMVCVAVLTGTQSQDELAPYADVVLPHIGHLPRWLGLDGFEPD